MNDLTDLDIVDIIVGRLQGRSWRGLGIQYNTPAQTLRRHVKDALFPTRKKR